MKILVTGGCGFIGSALCRHLIQETDFEIVNLDVLTYAANLESVESIAKSDRYHFVHGSINDKALLKTLLNDHQPDAIMNLAAESHVDRSIDSVHEFLETNVVGTVTLLEEARRYWSSLDPEKAKKFRFHHISTDEVYGTLSDTGAFTEETPYDPRSPYSASKAASDHFVRAWYHTYGLPILITNCSNNYGPFHFPEKLIPLTIWNAIQEKPLPIYGTGENIRDWIFVEDHVCGLLAVLTKAKVGETYNIGGNAERKNKDVVLKICEILDKKLPRSNGKSYADLITYVADRPGHDFRYAIDHSKITKSLGWMPEVDFETGISKTIDWYLKNIQWLKQIQATRYGGERLGKAI